MNEAIDLAGGVAVSSSPRLVLGLPAKVARLYALVFAVAFGVYVLLWREAPLLEPDSSGYMQLAENLSSGHFLGHSIRTPGYPILLALLSSSRKPTHGLFLVSLGLHLVVIWLLASLLSYLGCGLRCLLIFAVLLLMPPYVESSAYVMTENLAEFCLSIGFASLCAWLFCKRVVWLWISAFSFVYGALTRPTFQAAALAVMASLWIIRSAVPDLHSLRHNLRRAASVLLVSSLVLASWSIFNYVIFGESGTALLTLGLSTRTLRFVERLPDDYAEIRDALIRARNKDLVQTGSSHLGYQFVGGAIGELEQVTGLPESEIYRRLLRANLLLIAKAPLTYCEEVSRGVLSFWFPHSAKLANMNSRLLQFMWSVLHFAAILCFAIQSLVIIGSQLLQLSVYLATNKAHHPGVLEATPHQIAGYYIALTLIVYTLVISCFFQTGDSRYRLPIDPLIAFVGFLGIHIWSEAIRRMRGGKNPLEASARSLLG